MEVAPVTVEAMEVAVGMEVAVAAAVEDMDHQVVHKVLDLGAQIKEDQTVAPVALGAPGSPSFPSTAIELNPLKPCAPCMPREPSFRSFP